LSLAGLALGSRRRRRQARRDRRRSGATRQKPAQWIGLQPLEQREMLSVNVLTPLPNVSAVSNQGATVIELGSHFDDTEIVGSVVKFDTVMGAFYAELYDIAKGSRAAAPLSTAHFLNHVNNNLLPGSTTTRFSSYDNTLIHRVDTNVGVIQGGGFAYPGFTTQPQGPTVANEYSATRPNTRGTIAFAKVGGNPNSATNQWFINTKDNTTVLGPANNGGFTTFGQVLGSGMTVVDAIAALPTVSGTSLNPSIGTQLPLRNTPPSGTGPNNVVLVNSISEVPEVLFTATSSNAALVHTAVNDGQLVLNFGSQTGTATITIRATAHTGEFTEATFTVNVGAAVNPPTVTALNTSGAKVARGKTITLTAAGVADAAPGSVSKVEFYRDSNGNGVLDPGVDALVGEDTSATGGWSLTLPTTGQASGNATFFARAIDNANQGSSPIAATVNITNAAPTIKTIPTLGVAQRNAPTTLSYATLAQFADEADANGDVILFRIEQVFTGTMTKGGVAVVPGTTTIGPGESVVWTPPQDTDGTLKVFSFKVSDGEAVSTKAATLSFIVNKPPTTQSMAVSPRPLSYPGGPLTLTAKATDADGAVARVEFFRDSNNNGVFDAATDQKLGQDTNPTGGWSLTTNGTSSFPTGEVRYFARAIDNNGQAGNAVTVVGQVNVPPTLGTFSTTAPVLRPGDITLTLANVLDAGGSIKLVEFLLDIDGSNTVTDNDPVLGKATLVPGTNNYTLTVPTTFVQSGSTRFIARVTDNHGGVSTKAVNAAITARPGNVVPVVTGLTTKTTVVNRSQSITLSPAGVADSDGGVRYVEFYRDNGDGIFTPAQDAPLTRDYSSTGGWTTTTTIPSSATPGPLKFFVRAVDFDGGTSEVRSIEVNVNAPPTIASLSAPATLARGAALTLTAVNVADTLGGTIKGVEFYQDSNRNGMLDSTDKRIGKGKASSGSYIAKIATKKMDSGATRFFARAVDNNGAVSNTVTTVVTLTA
jgi:cyclophilin family peptidyl-prolyl cis-trans isomerase